MTSPDGKTTQLQNLLDALPGTQQTRDELVAHASERLYTLARKMLMNYPRLRRWEQTDDVFQNAVMRLHRSLAETHPETVRGFFGLAATQTRRTLIDLARHHFGPRGQAAQHESGTAWLSKEGDHTGQPETLEAWAYFHEAVEQLPDQEREVFELTWYGDLSQSEVAELLDVSVRTVKRRWRAARMELATVLEQDEREQ